MTSTPPDAIPVTMQSPELRDVPRKRIKYWLLLVAMWGAVLFWLLGTSYVLWMGTFPELLTLPTVFWHVSGGGVLLAVALIGTQLVWREANLRHERNLLRLLIDSVPDQLYIKDTDSRFIIANLSTAQINGFDRVPDIIGKSDADYFPAELAAAYRAEELQIFQGEISLLRDERQPDNLYQGEHWLALKLPLYAAQGDIMGLVGIERSLVAQKRIEAVLREINENLQATLNALPVLLFELDSAGLILDYHSAIPELFFDTTSELLNQTVFDVLSSDSCAAITTAFHECQETKRMALTTVQVQTPTGTVWFECYISPKLMPDNRTGRFIMLVHDITARRRFEHQLAEERNLLRTLIDTLPDHIFVKDRASRFLLHNTAHAWEVTSRMTSGDVIGLTDFDFHPPDAAQHFFAQEQHLLQTGEPVIQDAHCIVLPDGEPIWVATSKTALRDTSGQIIGLVGVSHNVTEQRQR
ncbi:PAS domain-containing protein, partial [Chloroflexota bacterium]